MHSLKGASGFLGLNRINTLAHKSENILDELRKGSMQVTSEIMDVILASTDALRQMIDNLEATNSEGDVEIDSIIEQIDALMTGESAPPIQVQATVEEPDTPVEAQEATAPEEPVTESVEEPAIPAAAPEPELPPPTEEPAVESSGMSGKEWVAMLPERPKYALTAFGEGHLKDFIDESFEIIENLNEGLLELETSEEGGTLVNDLFRYFHNMKGNSGIIGYNELNALTHEAETLLNNVRQGKLSPSRELVDLLLLAVDTMEGLVQRIDVAGGSATPVDIDPLLKQLREAVTGGAIELPADFTKGKASPATPVKAAEKPAAAEVEVVQPNIIPAGKEDSDAEVFRLTVTQQMEIIRAGLSTLRKDGSHKDSIDAIYRCLTAVKNACGFVGQNEIKVYAERTAGIVDQGRKQGIDFGLMVDLLGQEVGIIDDMITKALEEGKIGEAGNVESAPPASEAKVAAEKPVEKQPEQPAAPKAQQPAQPAPAPAKEAPKAPAASKPPVAAKPAEPARAAKPAQPGKPGGSASEAHKSSSTIRVDHERLDHLMNLIGELIINRNRYALIARSLEGREEDINVAEVCSKPFRNNLRNGQNFR